MDLSYFPSVANSTQAMISSINKAMGAEVVAWKVTPNWFGLILRENLDALKYNNMLDCRSIRDNRAPLLMELRSQWNIPIAAWKIKHQTKLSERFFSNVTSRTWSHERDESADVSIANDIWATSPFVVLMNNQLWPGRVKYGTERTAWDPKWMIWLFQWICWLLKSYRSWECALQIVSLTFNVFVFSYIMKSTRSSHAGRPMHNIISSGIS